MIDKILKTFGLMRISQARHITNETVGLLSRKIADYARADFGAPINGLAEADNREWADECFDQMLAEGPGGSLVGAWEIE